MNQLWPLNCTFNFTIIYSTRQKLSVSILVIWCYRNKLGQNVTLSIPLYCKSTIRGGSFMTSAITGVSRPHCFLDQQNSEIGWLFIHFTKRVRSCYPLPLFIKIQRYTELFDIMAFYNKRQPKLSKSHPIGKHHQFLVNLSVEHPRLHWVC